MSTLADLKRNGTSLFSRGSHRDALLIYSAIVAQEARDFESRLHVADCLVALGQSRLGIEVYRATARYALRAGHPLAAVVAARVVETLGGEFDDLLAMLVSYYGCESELVGDFAGRINIPDGSTVVSVPHQKRQSEESFLVECAETAIHCTDEFGEYPAALHPIPLLSELPEQAFRRVLATLVVRRLGHGQTVISEGDVGTSFFFVATGDVVVFDRDSAGARRDLAHLRENSVVGEMALLSARPRIATVEAVGEAALLEVTRDSLAALANELDHVAAALNRFTRERLLSNLMSKSPLFRPFSKQQQHDLLSRFTAHDVAAGTNVIVEGDDGRGLFVMLSGQAVVLVGEAVVATLNPGDVFGEMALIRGGATTATVRATEPGSVLFLSKEMVDRMVAGIPAIRDYLTGLADDRALDTRLALATDEADEGWVQILI